MLMAFDMKLIDAHMIKRSFKSFTDSHLLERTTGTDIPEPLNGILLFIKNDF